MESPAVICYVALTGNPNCGKTTLFNLISGRFPITSGTIAVNGQSTAGMAPQEINRLGLSRSFQITSIFPRMTVFENIAFGLRGHRPRKFSRAEIYRREISNKYQSQRKSNFERKLESIYN